MKFLKIPGLFSLDISAGAVAGSLLAARVLGIELSLSYFLILFMSTLIIYSSDHLLDGFRQKGQSQSESHRFFYKYRNPILVGTVFLAIFDIRMAFYVLDRRLIEFGFIMGGFIIVYFLLNAFYQQAEKVVFVKEMWISLLYCFAIFGGPLIIYEKPPPHGIILLFISYGLLVFSNVMIYSFYEYEYDLKDGEKTLTTQYGKTISRIIILISLSLALISWISSLVLSNVNIYILLIMLVMNLILFCIVFFTRYFSINDRYGWLADAVFLLPFLILLLPW